MPSLKEMSSMSTSATFEKPTFCYPSTQSNVRMMSTTGTYRKISKNRAAPIVLHAQHSSSTTTGETNEAQMKKTAQNYKDQVDLKSKVKYIWKSYGIVAIGTYFGLYITTLSSIFFALDFDIFNSATVGLDPVVAIHKVIADTFF